MKYILTLLLSVSFLFGCAQKKRPIKGESAFQIALNKEYKDASTSPLKEKDLKKFKGLDFFRVDSSFVVKAKLIRTPDSSYFKMKTTTSRLATERVYAVLMFNLKGKECRLNVYQGKETITQEGYEDYLFLPFLDNTNGDTTYGGGRYIELRIPEGDEIYIDFNKAYNPYCAYNEKYSCPIVPRINYLDIEVKAGVKAFVK